MTNVEHYVKTSMTAAFPKTTIFKSSINKVCFVCILRKLRHYYIFPTR